MVRLLENINFIVELSKLLTQRRCPHLYLTSSVKTMWFLKFYLFPRSLGSKHKI